MMAYKDDHNLFVGGKYGSFKGLHCSLDKILTKNLQNTQYISPQSHITVMKWGDEEERELLIATANQTVKVYDTEYKSYVQNIPVKYGQGPICGVSRFDGVLVTAVESGQIRIWTPRRDKEEIIIDPEDLDLQLSVDDEAIYGADIITGKNLSCMQHNEYSKTIIGSGGKGNDLKLWDLTTKQKIFNAKNLPDDAVRLAEPIWVSDLTFLPQQSTVAVCSRYGYVRLYDPKTQRKPVWALKVPEEALTCMASVNDHSVICGMAKGDMLMVDFRMKKLLHKYKGFLGAVRGISVHPRAPYIASVSLDRHFRIHDRDSKKLLVKEYLKLPIHCVAMRSDAVFTESEASARKSQKRKNEEDAELEEYNNMLNSLEKVEEKPSKKLKAQEKSKQRLFVNPFASLKAVPLKRPPGSDCPSNTEDDPDDDDNYEDEESDDNDHSEGEELDDDDHSEDEESDDSQDSKDHQVSENDDSDCMIVE